MEKTHQLLVKYKNIIIFCSIISIISLFGYLYRYEIESMIGMLKNQEQLKEYLDSFGPLAVVVFGLMQVIQVVIFFIPGEVIQAAGGYAFGTFQGTLASIIGINIGGAIIFLLTKKYKERLVNKVVPKKVKKSVEKIFNSDKLNYMVFLIYLLPGMPKDSLIFLCALSKISFKDFMIYSTLGRLPALTFSCYYGHTIANGNKYIVVAATIIVVIIGAIGLLFKDNILKSIQKTD